MHVDYYVVKFCTTPEQLLSLLLYLSPLNIISEPAVPYSITVKALNLAGCGEEEQVYCFTQEGGKAKLYRLKYINFVSCPISSASSPRKCCSCEI